MFSNRFLNVTEEQFAILAKDRMTKHPRKDVGEHAEYWESLLQSKQSDGRSRYMYVCTLCNRPYVTMM